MDDSLATTPESTTLSFTREDGSVLYVEAECIITAAEPWYAGCGAVITVGDDRCVKWIHVKESWRDVLERRAKAVLPQRAERASRHDFTLDTVRAVLRNAACVEYCIGERPPTGSVVYVCHECFGIWPGHATAEVRLLPGQHYGHSKGCEWGALMAWAKGDDNGHAG